MQVPGKDTDATPERRCGKVLEECARWENSIVAVCEKLALAGLGGLGFTFRPATVLPVPLSLSSARGELLEWWKIQRR